MQKIKPLKLGIFLLISYFVLVGGVHAASLSLSKSSGNVGVGSTVKITAKAVGFGQADMGTFSLSYDQDRFTFVSASGDCNGLYCIIESGKSVVFTFKAKSQGSGTFSASGAYEGDSSGSLSAQTSVTVGESANKVLKTNDYLASLSVEGYELSPEFNRETLEYTLNLASDVTSVKINAKTEDETAKITGAGDVAVTEGTNTLNVVVTAENGSTRTYVIKANVEEKNPLKKKINGKTYTVVRNKDNLEKPNNYEDKTITIDGIEVPAFYSEITKYTLVGLKDSKGKIALYIYNEKKDTFTLYQEVKFSNINFYPMDITKGPQGYDFANYKKYEVDLNGAKVKGLKLAKDSRFAIIYGMDVETGEKDYYTFDSKNHSLQVYNAEQADLIYKEKELYSIIILAAGGVLLLCFAIIIGLCVKNSKRKKKIKNILEKLSQSDEGLDEGKDDIIDEEKIVDEVMEDENDEDMYNILEEKPKKNKRQK